MACGGWEGGIDSSQLEARLRAGIEADRRYATENSAKLRAIQSTPSYDEFRQLVLGSHLKPVDRSDKSKVRPSIWNSLASTATKKSSKSSPQDTENSVYPTDVQYGCQSGSGESNLASPSLSYRRLSSVPSMALEIPHFDVNNPPNTTEGLVQLWERLDLAERLELLRNLPVQATEKLAAGLVAGSLLGDAITTLLAFTPTVNDVVMVVNMLQALTLAKRFALSVTLVCGEERWAWGRLLEKLQLALSERPQDLAELNVTEWTLAQLKLKFNL
ncbi:coiled-coil domain-containing protein 103-like isoform X1 [Macrobrachium nipponense]|uniref:coiled-coil domain-containing protein 103-like isoform X1 n=1 Tax=Macrobrachium nipponense TaxID=159736 RepID=UPI0030C8C3B0